MLMVSCSVSAQHLLYCIDHPIHLSAALQWHERLIIGDCTCQVIASEKMQIVSSPILGCSHSGELSRSNEFEALSSHQWGSSPRAAGTSVTAVDLKLI